MDNVIVKITDKDIGFPKKKLCNPIIRYASRGIIFNDKNEIAVFYKKEKNEYKLPGGGINENEDKILAFHREILEETGCIVSNVVELGVAVEEKGETNFCQVSYIFEAIVDYDTKNLHLTPKEKDEGGKVLWVPLDSAYELISGCIDKIVGSKYDNRYKSLFMVKRDAEILKYYMQKYKNKRRKVKC